MSLPEQQSPEEQLKEEYYKACAEAGELQFKLKQFEAALNSVNVKISDVNKRYAELKQSQEPKASEASDVPAAS